MLIGAMNHPGRPVLDEIKWMAEMGLDFIDLTLEPPQAASWNVDLAAIREALTRHEFPAIGHTAYYLPFASPFASIRRAAIAEAARCIEAFAKIGVSWMNLHPDRHVPLHSREYLLDENLKTLRELLAIGKDHGVGLMIENLPGEFSTLPFLAHLLDPLPELGLHLDIGHANLLVPYNTTEEILGAYSDRLRHVHLHDNKGGDVDLHLPLGVGGIDLPRHVGALKASGYDATITLEVFSPDLQYLAHSRDVLRQIWDDAPAPARAAQDAKSSLETLAMNSRA